MTPLDPADQVLIGEEGDLLAGLPALGSKHFE